MRARSKADPHHTAPSPPRARTGPGRRPWGRARPVLARSSRPLPQSQPSSTPAAHSGGRPPAHPRGRGRGQEGAESLRAGQSGAWHTTYLRPLVELHCALERLAEVLLASGLLFQRGDLLAPR
eukprot:scaffold7235_cov583-Prasinococcus_capsulatus_cf.AAC.7